MVDIDASTGVEETLGLESVFGNTSMEDDISPNQDEVDAADADDGVPVKKGSTKNESVDEDDADESVDEDDADESVDEDDADESVDEDSRKVLASVFKINLQGVDDPLEVSVKEAIDNYTERETLLRAAEALEEDRGVISRVASDIIADKQQYADKLAEVEDVLRSLVPNEPDWDKVPPASYKQVRNDWDKYVKHISDVQDARNVVLADKAKQQTASKAEYTRKENAKTLALNKEWSNPKTLKRDFESMHKTAKSVGFGDAEIKDTVDHRMIAILFKAAKYDRIVAAQRRLVKPTNKTNKADNSNRTPNEAPTRNNSATAKLAKTGSVTDAADVFKQLIFRK